MKSIKSKTFDNDETKFAENLILSSIISKYEGINGGNLNYLPVLENKFTNRIYEEKNRLDSSFPKIVLEPFPLRNYFQLGLFFKLFLLFILFGFNIKGYSFSIFIAFLIIYYWYYINNDIATYYDTKIQELKFGKLNDEDLSKLLDLENFNEGTKDNVHNNNENIKNLKNDVKNDIKKSNDIGMDEETNKNSNENINSFDQSNRDIENKNEINSEGLQSPKEENNAKNVPIFDHRPNIVIRFFYAILEISVIFLLSMYPAWCDSFEDRNPIVENVNVDLNQNNNDQNIDQNNDQHLNERIEKGIEEENNYELYNHDFSYDNDSNKSNSHEENEDEDEMYDGKKYIHQVKPIKFENEQEHKKIKLEKMKEKEHERNKEVVKDDIKIEDINVKKNQ